MIKVARPFFRNKKLILKEIDNILESGRLMDGRMNKAFEEEFSSFVGTKYSSAVNSCTTAMEIVMRFVGIQRNDEVIVPVNTFVATANAVVFSNGKPVFADIKDGTYHIDPKEIARKITSRTKAVIVVHIAGIVCEDIFEIQKICKKRGLYLIEDCAHAAGAQFDGKKAGSFGVAGCFSFYPTKIMTTGTGGMITTDSAKLYNFSRSVKCHGRGKSLSDIIHLGNDWFMDEIRSAIGTYQLRDLDNMVSARRKIAESYIKGLKGVERIKIFPLPEESMPSYYKFPVQLDRTVRSSDFKRSFAKKYNLELETIYWPLCHLQPLYKKLLGYKKGDFPVAEKTLISQITLPIHPLIKKKDIDFVIKSLREELCG